MNGKSCEQSKGGGKTEREESNAESEEEQKKDWAGRGGGKL